VNYQGNAGHLRGLSKQAHCAAPVSCTGSWNPEPPRHHTQQRTPISARLASVGDTAKAISTTMHASSSLFITASILA
jgi:hypothetical protein